MSVFEIVRGVEGDCLVLDGTRICGSKPWGGGRIIKTFHTDGIYEVIDKDEYHKLQAENAKLRELVTLMYRDMQGVLDMSTDTVWVDDIGTLRDEMDYHMQAMAELGMPTADYEQRIRELGIEVE